MLVQADARRRITIPAAAGVNPGDSLEVEILPDGRMLLVPVVAIPKHQLWAWSPEVRAAAAESLADPRLSTVIESGDDAEATAGRWEDES
ncbi:MAG: AbrB/MazE/SpoVT family DNA-binding domain-containing protein [Deferrisomatales bacterium]